MSKVRVKRAVFWLLLAVFTGASVWWMLTVPYRPGEVLRAIPAEAVFVSWHRAPAARWDVLTSNALVRAAGEAEGLNWAALEAGLATDRGRAWLARLAGREMAIAYVPAMPRSGAPAWVISCWAGGYSQRLRWLLSLWGPRPMQARGRNPGKPVWLLQPDGLPPGWHLSLSVREGLVVAAISPDPQAVWSCMLAAEGAPYALNMRTAGLEQEAQRWFQNPAGPDRGWLKAADPAGGRADWWFFEADLRAPDAWSLTARGATAAPRVEGLGLETLAGLSDKAEGVMTAPWSWLRALAWQAAPDWTAAVDRLVRESAGGDAPVWLALYGGEHAGRIRSLFGSGMESFIRGLKTPLLAAAIPAPDEPRARAAVARFLDDLNRRVPLGLVLRPAGVCHGRELTAVEGTRSGMYRDFAPAEQAVFTVAEGWLVLASHLGAFENLVPALPHGAPPSEPGLRGVWGQVQGAQFAGTAGKFLAALSLVYGLGDGPDAERMRERLAAWRARLHPLEKMGRVEFAWTALDNGSMITVEARP